MSEATTPKRGRPSTGAAKSNTERSRELRARVARGELLRVDVLLEQLGQQDLATVKALGGHRTDVAAVSAALATEAKRLARRSKRAA